MSESFKNLPDHIKNHLVNLIKSSNLPDTDEYMEKIGSMWLDKKEMFESQIKLLDMIEVENISKDTSNAMLLLTYSGSLLSVGPLESKHRWIEYASINLRPDVPEIAKSYDSNISNDVSLNQTIELTNGPIKSSSALFKITTFKDEVSLDEQDKRIREATIFLTNGFVKINRTHFKPAGRVPEQFNNSSIISYLASKNQITKKQAKQILEDYQFVIESGMLLGERVSFGNLGKLYLKKRPAKKARVGRNPLTGEQITIAAKPESYVPKASFSKNFKQKASNIEIK